MMNRQLILLLCIALIATSARAQVSIRGAVKSSRGESLPGVNAMIRGSFDGTTTDYNGEFGFSTLKTGEQTLLLSFMGFKTKEVTLYLANDTILETLYMKEDATQLDAVVITAGTFEAGDQRKSVTLRPLDIVTTPSAAGDIYGTLTSLPGAAIVGEDGRLFVRGGDAYESKTFIDGMMVRQPYSSSIPDLPSRGRFSPFLFSGTTFSTGGYSAEYGQALSSALLLNINAFPEKTQTELSFMSVGLGARQTLKSDNGSLSVGAEYTNLKPYIRIVPETYTWNQHPTEMGANLFGHRKTAGNGLLKFFSNISASQSGLAYPDLSATPGSHQDIFLDNKNLYTQLTYMQDHNDWVLMMGVAFGYDADSISMERFSVQEDYYSGQVRLRLSRTFSDQFSIKTGAEAAFTDYTFWYRENDGGVDFEGSFSEYLPAVFVEAESRPFHRLAVRTGLRHEYSSVIGKHATAWRTSAAWLFNADWQASVAAGSFYQTPEEDILRYATQLHFEKANHYIANIQYEKQNRILRAELYRKAYSRLVRFDEDLFFDPALYNNRGEGYARGVDLFFRDRSTFRTLDYWISYSWVDARRIYRTFPEKVRPHFAPEHSFTLVGKKWVHALSTQFGASFSLAAGRPYHDPNKEAFMSERTKGYSDISMNASHLFSIWDQQSILYFSVSNVLGRNNVFGYRFYEKPDGEGNFPSLPISPSAKRFFLVGLFITIR